MTKKYTPYFIFDNEPETVPFQTALGMFNIGDVLFVTSNDFIANGIKQLSKLDGPEGIFLSSHTEVIVYLDEEGPVSLSAEFSGLTCRYTSARFTTKHSGEIWRPPVITPEQAGKLTALGLRYGFRNPKYDFLGLSHWIWWLKYLNMNDEDKFYCSENASTILQETKITPKFDTAISPIGLNTHLKDIGWKRVARFPLR